MTDFAKQTKVKGNTDEWLTPESAVYPLIPWLVIILLVIFHILCEC